jgi:hypothetical protein
MFEISNHRIIGNITTGFDEGHMSVIRDSENRVVGRISTRFDETRDNRGHVVSSNTADAGLLIRRK